MHPRLLPVAAVLLLGAAVADPLPAGLEQRDGVIMMQPIPDGSQGAAPALGDTDASPRQGASRVLSPADHDLFAKAFEAADRGDWPHALALSDRGQNAIAQLVIQWRYLQDKNSRATFEQFDAFAENHPEWPRRAALFGRAEETMNPATQPAAVIAWYGGRDPVSPIGMIRLGDAMIAAGKSEAGAKLVRQGWATGTFDLPQELAIVQKDGAYLNLETDRRRLDNLIWADQTTAARRQIARVDDVTQRITNAQIALRANPQRGEKMVREMGPDFANDTRLAFDRARAVRRLGDNATAQVLLLKAPLQELLRNHTTPVWNEVNLEARQALQDGKALIAYQLVSNTGLTSGNEFAEAEFLSGWIALRFLKDAQAALGHFKKLTDGVSRPISEARGRYWMGRSCEALGDDAQAWRQYREAADYSETFYGQLALARIDATPTLHLTSAQVDALPSRAAFDQDELVRAMRVLGDLGAQELLRAFALRYEELHPDRPHVKLLAQSLTDWGFRDVALRIAKVAGYGGPTFPPYSFPTIPIPDYHGPRTPPEAAIVLGIIRQETEFDPEAVSHAGARGIMQMMPAGAKRNAKIIGVPYHPNRLTTDAEYNMQLGMTEFSGYMTDWGNSLVLSVAAYNAGATNARRWIATFGDPRTATVDPVDWIESITFSETRNYVQRVIENVEVYRSRLAGHDAPLHIMTDLYWPNPPTVKVVPPPPPPKPPFTAQAPVPQPKPALRNARSGS